MAMRHVRSYKTPPVWHVLYGWVASCLLILLLLSACGEQSQPTQTTTAPTPTKIPANSFVNPVIRSDFADPGILQVGNTYYSYATNAFGKNIQVARSTDLVNWEELADAMPSLPSWAQLGGSYVWAPEVIQIGKTFVMYYTARDSASNKQCVGVATSTKPEGKFKDTSKKALVCQSNEGGTIDPSPLRSGNTLYLYFKNDGNCCLIPTYLYVQQLSKDGLKLVGTRKRLIRNDQNWEGNVIEAPSMYQHAGKFYLFYSANSYAGADYTVGYARCQTALGPCEKAKKNPILSSHMQQPLVIGPGGQSFINIGNQTWMVYHAWEVSGGTRGDSRFMWLDRVDWQGDTPVVHGPTTDPQPKPAA